MKVSTTGLAAGLLAASAAPAMGKRLLVGGTTLSLFDFDTSTNRLTLLQTMGELGRNPSWQEFSKDGKFILSSSEGQWGQATSGKVGTYRLESNGRMSSLISSQSAFWGTVSITDDGKGNLFAASYDSNAITTYRIDSQGFITSREQIKYTMPQRGPHNRQDAPHPHQVLLDPSQKFLIVPDLGADFVRVYAVESDGRLTAQSNVVSAPASGPRHGIFWPNGKNDTARNFYVINELSNTVVGHNVTYSDSTIELKPTQTLSSYGDRTAPQTWPQPTAAELAISPDGKFLYASNRSDRLQDNGQSDSLAIYSRSESGQLTFVRLTSAGGIGPRHFSLDSTGEYLVAGLGGSNRVVVFRRNAQDGSLTKLAEASAQVPACVTFLD